MWHSSPVFKYFFIVYFLNCELFGKFASFDGCDVTIPVEVADDIGNYMWQILIVLF